MRDKFDRYYSNNKSLAFEDCMDFSEDEEIELDPPTKRWNLIQSNFLSHNLIEFICSKNVHNFSGQVEEISRRKSACLSSIDIRNPTSSHGKRRRYKCKKVKTHANASLNIPFQNQAQKTFSKPLNFII